jgi:hypothetical protein
VTGDNIPHFENNVTHVELDYFTNVELNWMIAMWQEGTKWPGDEMTGDEMKGDES